MKSTANPSDFIFRATSNFSCSILFFQSSAFRTVIQRLFHADNVPKFFISQQLRIGKSWFLQCINSFFSLPDYLSNLRALRECFRWFRSDSVTTTLASSFHYMYAGWTWVVLRISNAGHQSLYRYSPHEPDDNSDRKPVIQIQTFRSLDWANTQVEAVHITRPNWFGVRMLWKHWAIHAAWIPETRSSASQQ